MDLSPLGFCEPEEAAVEPVESCFQPFHWKSTDQIRYHHIRNCVWGYKLKWNDIYDKMVVVNCYSY